MHLLRNTQGFFSRIRSNHSFWDKKNKTSKNKTYKLVKTIYYKDGPYLQRIMGIKKLWILQFNWIIENCWHFIFFAKNGNQGLNIPAMYNNRPGTWWIITGWFLYKLEYRQCKVRYTVVRPLSVVILIHYTLRYMLL